MAGCLQAVALQAWDETGRPHPPISGLALCTPGALPLVLTLGSSCGSGEASAMLPMDDGRAEAVAVSLVGSGRIAASKLAFQALAVRGWRCSSQCSGPPAVESTRACNLATNFSVQLWRGARPLPAGQEAKWVAVADWGGYPDESWVGAAVTVVARPFAAGLQSVVTRGVIANVSTPAGLLLLDARCVEGSAGGGVLLEPPRGHGGASRFIACIAPPLRSNSNETVALSLALPLAVIARALLDDVACSHSLSTAERAVLAATGEGVVTEPQVQPPPALALVPSLPRRSTAAPSGVSMPSWITALTSPSAAALTLTPTAMSAPMCTTLATAARQGVVLLWLESTGSWASAVVISEAGHLVTCAHLLTGRSWMEVPLQEQPRAAVAAAASSHPRSCRGRGQVRRADGRFMELTFEVEVLHICGGCLDVALLCARTPPGGQPLCFAPLPWHDGPAAGGEGAEVWAVGHGLFGPGTPWRGPTVTRGHVVKVARGANGRAALLQSSAAVHRGCSGGALVEATGGTLVGLVTTNVKQQDGAIMPHVNFSLPVELLAPFRDFVTFMGASTETSALLEVLANSLEVCTADKYEQTLWRLEPEPLDLPSIVEDRKQQAVARMRRLADEAADCEAAASEAPPPSLPVPPPQSAL